MHGQNPAVIPGTKFETSGFSEGEIKAICREFHEEE